MPTNRARHLAGLFAGALGTLLLAAPLVAQEQEQAEERDIVVTGRAERSPPTSSEVTRQARAITQGSDLRHSAQARFEKRLCPGVIGLKPDMAALVIDRIRYHARQFDLGLTKDDGTCAPNLVVAFVRDGKAELAALAADHGYLFQDMPLHERQALLAEEGPVRVWTTTLDRTRDGMPVPRTDGGPAPVVSMWMAHSKIYLATREDIEFVVVLFDLEKMKGKTLVQLADYATMRGLARTRPVAGAGEAGGPAMDTILALFDPAAEPPAEMTDFDRAYIAALYDGIANIPGITKVQGVNRQLRMQEAAAADETAE
jgi:hypothetical protein